MKGRIKEIRKNAGETQQAFADRLHISKSTVEGYEYGRLKAPDRTISDICREYKVNETWLRTGEGEMFAPTTRNQAIAQICADLMNNDPEDLQVQWIELIHSLSQDDLELLTEIAKKVAEKFQ